MITEIVPSTNLLAQCASQDRKVDILVQNVRRNRRNSPLLRLPEETLLLLMRNMDIDTVLRLRHVSRTFMRLFHIEESFEGYYFTKRQGYTRFKHVARVWAVPNLSFQNQSSSWIKPVCDDCRLLLGCNHYSASTTANSPRLHCAACERTHERCHFSENQQQEPDVERICKAHERKFTLCKHMSLSLQQIKWQAKTRNKVDIPCSRDHERKGIQCSNTKCADSGRPYIKIRNGKNGSIHMDIMLSLHFSLRRLPSGKICGPSLRREILRLEETEKDRRWLPIFASAHGNLLRAFDPNICDCVDWFGDSSKTTKGGIDHPELPLRSAAALERREDAEKGWYTATEGRCAFMSHRVWHESKGKRFSINVRECLSRKHMAVACQTLTCRIDLKAPTESGFGSLLDGEILGCALSTCPSNECGLKQLKRYDIDIESARAKLLQTCQPESCDPCCSLNAQIEYRMRR